MSAKKGLPVVYEGRRINLRVYQRIFYPLIKTLDGKQYTLYNDTGKEKEIRYASAEYYGLDNPFNRVRLIRLARAMNCLTCYEKLDEEIQCSVTICSTRELYGVDADVMRWVPFDPGRQSSLKEKVKDLERKVKWQKRMSSS